ncbi:hypothetical protein HYR99_26265 [Candidatus Poribacteria bacterium]|nr:hypothetical protein [Candidatus Poribacteria bacterium]
MPLEFVFVIVSVLAGLVATIATVVSFIKQPYQPKGTQAAEGSQLLKQRQVEALHRAHKALQQLECAALEIRQREEDLLYLLAENPQSAEEVQQVLHQHRKVLHPTIEALEQQEKKLQRAIGVSQPIQKLGAETG